MRDYPEKIEGLSLELHETTAQLESLREKISHEEAILTLDVVTAKDETGKALYPNESLRSAALTLAREQSEQLRALNEETRRLDRRRAELFARLERLRLEFRLFLLDRQTEVGNSTNI